MSIYSQFETVDGTVPVKFPANKDGSIPTFYLARMAETNREYQLAIATALAPHANDIRLNVFDPKKKESIFNEIFCQYILKGWDNILDRSGAVVAYSREAAVKLMGDLPELYDILYKFAGNMSNFLVENQEADAKN